MKSGLLLIAMICSLSLTAQSRSSEPFFLKDIAYKIVEKDTIKLDIHLPTQNIYEKTPVVVFIHGGAWARGNKEIKHYYTQNIKDTLQANGYAVVAINYRLVNKVTNVADQLNDCKNALTWIINQANHYNFDTENIGLWGESAGAHLALLTAFTADTVQTPYEISYIIDNFGPTNLNKVLKTNASWFTKKTYQLFLPELYYMREKLIRAMTSFDINTNKEEAIAVARQYSPINHVQNVTKIPVLILHGSKDFIVPFKQSKKLHKQLNKQLVPNKLIKVKKGNHGFTKTAKNDLHELINEIVAFIQKHYKTNVITNRKSHIVK